ncbi:hypothetical protein [Ferruginibacter sp. SUN106]|uniref:hypothetical protein n=1 Tax=Ferruginibacter sp. SUN106 TaxID=2978348 RepID=UPI003D367FBB
MQRVDTLIKKLQEQFAAKVPAGQLLLTVQMLELELFQLQEAAAPDTTAVNVDIPQTILPAVKREEEKTVEILQVDEAEIEAELEEIRRNAEAMQKISVQNKPQIIFEQEQEQDIPTLTHHLQETPVQKREVHETIGANAASLNDKLRQSKIDLGDSLTESPIRDLKKAIGINDRFLYINELFRGDESMYERSIKTINGFSILAEAEYWIQRELKTKIGWSEDNEIVKQFIQLVKRRFI